MSVNRDFKGVWIPKEIWLNKDLSAIDKCIFAEINSLDNEDHCYASNEYFAEFCGVSEATVKRSIQKLKSLGLIKQISFDGRTRVIEVIQETAQNERETDQNELSEGSICATNNIEISKEEEKDNNIINKNSAKTDEEEYKAHSYSKDDFLGSASVSRQKKAKRSNLYQKCWDEILLYTGNLKLQDELGKYLQFRLSNKDKILYGVEQWKRLLAKLSEVSGETGNACEKRLKIVQQSIERGWGSFFPLNERTGHDKFAEYGKVDCTKNKEEECADEEF